MAEDQDYKPWVVYFGPIQWLDEDELDNGEAVRRATIKAVGKGHYVRCTIWDNFSATEIAEGDWIFVEGPGDTYDYENEDGEVSERFAISVNKLAVMPLVERKERKVVNKSKGTAKRKTAAKREPAF